jgi:hypothetical protein
MFTRYSQNVKVQYGCLGLFGLCWSAFSFIFVLVGLFNNDLIFISVGSLFVLLGLAIFARGALALYSRYRVGEPKIEISSRLLGIGERFTVSYAHTFARAVKVDKIHLQLIFRETAIYNRGTDTKTVRYDEIIRDFEERGDEFKQGSIINKTYELQIPPYGMHSLIVRRNKLQWFIKFRLDIPKLPDFVEEYELQVLPEIR